MSTEKSEKELAYLHELYVATDWGERFAGLVDEHVKLPEKGRALYVASGTGAHALALATRAPRELTLVCVDESEERLELARAKASAVRSDEVEFRHAQLEALAFEDEAVRPCRRRCVARRARAPARSARGDGSRRRAGRDSFAVVATASSFGEFFSVYWEALLGSGYGEQAEEVASFIKELPTVSELEAMAAREALEGVESWTSKEEFVFASGREFLDAPLVGDFLLGRWLGSLPDDERARRRARRGRAHNRRRPSRGRLLALG